MSDTRQRLVEAAERLFASRGIDAVSLAEVTAAAGLNNTGAVHYHFGGREELLDAVVEQHRTELDRRRDVLFDELEDDGEITPTTLVRVLIEPLLGKLDGPRGRAFLSIQAQRMLRPGPRPAADRPVALRFLRLLGTPHVARPVADLLGELTQMLTFGALAQRARLEAGDDDDGNADGRPGRASEATSGGDGVGRPGEGEGTGAVTRTATAPPLSRDEFAEQLIDAIVRVLQVPTSPSAAP